MLSLRQLALRPLAANRLRHALLAALALTFAILAQPCLSPAQARDINALKAGPPFPFSCNVKVDPQLTAKLHNTKGFVGGDSAYSIELGKGRQLWLFGDSFIGEITTSAKNKTGKRDKCRMVRNCIAIDDPSKPRGKVTYYYKDGDFFPCFEDHGRAYYWPADGLLLNGKLYLFMHVVHTKKNMPPPFQFEVGDTHLLVVKNPQDQPLKWKWHTEVLPYKAKLMMLACAIRREGDDLYFFNSNCGFAFGMNKNPTVVSKMKVSELENFQFHRMRWWCGHWGPKEDVPETLIEDGASEMTVTDIPGRKGLFAFYIPADKSALMVRHADRPEGPWSERQALYSFKDDKNSPEKGLFYYAAKAHRIYSHQDGVIKLTYNSNSRYFNQLIEDASIYFPQALTLKVSKPRSPSR